MLSEWLKDALKVSGMSQAELARQLDATLSRSFERSAVNKMTKNKRRIAADEMLAIARITNHAPPQISVVSSQIGAREILEMISAILRIGMGMSGMGTEWVAQALLQVLSPPPELVSPDDRVAFVRDETERILQMLSSRARSPSAAE